jgi:hypothetical protein
MRLPVLFGDLRGPESLRSVYVFCRTPTPCVPSQIFQVELSGVTAKSAVPQRQLAALRKNVLVREGPPENFENARGLPCLFILDDLLNEVFSRAVCDLLPKVATAGTSV